MIDYAELLTQMDKLKKQMRQAALRQDWKMARELALMHLTENRLLVNAFADLAQKISETSSNAD